MLNGKKLCVECVQPQEYSSECGRASLSECAGQPNSVTHYNKSNVTNIQSNPESSSVQAVEPQQPVRSHFGGNRTESQKLLSTVWLRVDGSNTPIRVLFGSGCQNSIIAEYCVQRLNVSRNGVSVCGNRVGSSYVRRAQALVTLKIKSCYDSSNVLDENVLVLNQFIGPLPSSFGQQLNDPVPVLYSPNDIKMLNGANPTTDGGPTAKISSLGWNISGPDLTESIGTGTSVNAIDLLNVW